MNFVPNLLGYDKFEIDDKYEEKYSGEEFIYKPNGIWINVNLNGDTGVHFISHGKLQDIIENHRIGSINSIIEDIGITERDTIFDHKVGDIVFFEFQLHYINEMFDDTIRGVNNGFGSSNGLLNDRCYRPDPIVMRMSNSVLYWWKELTDLTIDDDNYNINGANLHGILVDLWKYSIDNKNNNKFYDFIEEFQMAIDQKKYDYEYEGEKLFHKIQRVNLVNKINN
jgi:hypothetical protein